MNPLVSVCCITYNHEKYIADAIESFIMQKTDFPIEIIIHDDASTDNTAGIIREYEKKYPSIIKPIYQTENQFSKGKKIMLGFVLPQTKGKYIATCEGDDFWTDPLKLQKQVDFLEANEDYSMCFHAVNIIDTNKNCMGRYLGPHGKGNNTYSMKDCARGGFVHASSRVTRKKYYKQEMPKWFLTARHGDYATAVYFSANGRVYFIDEVMSSYRTGVENSLMTKSKENYSKKNQIEYCWQRISTLQEADRYYNYKFHDDIENVNIIYEMIILLHENNFKKSSWAKYQKFIKQQGVVALVKLALSFKFPKLSEFLSKGKRQLLSITYFRKL